MLVHLSGNTYANGIQQRYGKRGGFCIRILTFTRKAWPEESPPFWVFENVRQHSSKKPTAVKYYGKWRGTLLSDNEISSQAGLFIRRLTSLLVVLGSATVVHRAHYFLHSLIAKSSEIIGSFFSQHPDLWRGNEREHILNARQMLWP